jgi:hypothetical protein
MEAGMARDTEQKLFDMLYLSDNTPKYADIAKDLHITYDEVSSLNKIIRSKQKAALKDIQRLKQLYIDNKDGDGWRFESFKEFYMANRRPI